ncbi:MAG: hypothetical protein HC872_06100 [Gammaproteobacteria bacterium]|nr:hypothetical protein [Gammaproteobacteria bacterium]
MIFFGAGYGAGDVFLTPLGELYGVEVHAAAYLSDGLSHNRLIDFVLDLFIAFSFGFVIASFWGKYFAHRFSYDAYVRQSAPLSIILLILTVAAMVVAFVIASLFMLVYFGIWLSPIPLAIGMIIDSFVSGSVERATDEYESMRRKLSEALAVATGVQRDPEADVPEHERSRVVMWLAGWFRRRQRRTAGKSANTTRRPSRSVAWFARWLPRPLGGAVFEMIGTGKHAAASLQALWTVLFVATLAWWLYVAFFAEHA